MCVYGAIWASDWLYLPWSTCRTVRLWCSRNMRYLRIARPNTNTPNCVRSISALFVGISTDGVPNTLPCLRAVFIADWESTPSWHTSSQFDAFPITVVNERRITNEHIDVDYCKVCGWNLWLIWWHSEKAISVEAVEAPRKEILKVSYIDTSEPQVVVFWGRLVADGCNWRCGTTGVMNIWQTAGSPVQGLQITGRRWTEQSTLTPHCTTRYPKPDATRLGLLV